MMRRSIGLLFILLIVPAMTRAQVKTVADYLNKVRALANRADVKAAGGRRSDTEDSPRMDCNH
jgi:hypothetical protein